MAEPLVLLKLTRSVTRCFVAYNLIIADINNCTLIAMINDLHV